MKKTGDSDGKRLIDFLGKEYKGYIGIDAINKLLETGEGHIFDAFERDYFGKISLIWGNEFKGGLSHIVKRRIRKMSYEELEKFLRMIPDIIKTGRIKYNKKTKRYEFIKNKKILVVDILTEDSGIKFLLTGFREDD